MKCPQCGLENRPDARFCKQCGQPLQAQAAQPVSPPPTGDVCPACGATAKPGTRFCSRCGKPLPAEPAQPSPPPAGTEPAMPPTPQPYAAPPSPPPPAAPAYAQPPVQLPPPAVPAAAEHRRRFPRWAWWVGTIVALVCVVVLVVTVWAFGPKLLGGEEEPTATVVPATQTPPAETSATKAPTVASPTETTATEPPTAMPVPTSTFDAQVGIAASAAELQTGDLLTITVTVTNIGQVTFGNLHYQLMGEWAPFLGTRTGTMVGHEVDVPSGGSDTATFVLEAVQAGTAQIHANVTMTTREEQPSVKPVSSEHIVEVSVIQ